MSTHRARKRFGQNFLRDSGIIDRIHRSVRPQAEDAVVEIGPGQGALTEQLATSGAADPRGPDGRRSARDGDRKSSPSLRRLDPDRLVSVRIFVRGSVLSDYCTNWTV